MIGIYAIENKVTGECYVGKSQNIPARFQQHIAMLERGEHHSIKLQRAYDSRGISDFVFKVLEECSVEQLDQKEAEWIAKLNAIEKGYNVRQQPNEIQHSTWTRVADALYRAFKRECTEYGLTISEGIEMIIDREIMESRRNIDLLESLKGALSERTGEIVYEEESNVKRTVRYTPRNTSRDEIYEHVKSVALEVYKQTGRFPSQRALAEMAGCTRYRAMVVLDEIKKKFEEM